LNDRSFAKLLKSEAAKGLSFIAGALRLAKIPRKAYLWFVWDEIQ